MNSPSPAAEPLFSRRTAFVAVALTALFAVIMHLEGRPAWCKYGFGIWADAWTHCTSQHFLDPYSLSHVLHGILFFWLLQPLANKVNMRWRVIIALTLEIGWELLENSPWVIEHYRRETAAFDYTGDSILNAVGDVAMAAIGVAIAARCSWKVSVILFIVLELVALYLALRQSHAEHYHARAPDRGHQDVAAPPVVACRPAILSECRTMCRRLDFAIEDSVRQ